MAYLKWSNLYTLSITDRTSIVTFIKADAEKHQKLIDACDVDTDVDNVAAVVPTVSFATDAHQPPVLNNSNEPLNDNEFENEFDNEFGDEFDDEFDALLADPAILAQLDQQQEPVHPPTAVILRKMRMGMTNRTF